MSEKERISLTDAAAQADVDDDDELTDADLGNDGAVDDESDERAPTRKPAKKAAKPAVEGEDAPEEAEEEEEDESEEEEEEEESAPDVERAKLAKKLARTSAARTKLELQVADQRRQLDELTRDKSDATKQRMEKVTAELDELYEKVEELRVDGKSTEAAKFQRRIDDIRDNMTRSQATYHATREALQQAEVRAFNTMVRELETLDPRFDPDHDDYDEELLSDVNDLIEGFEGRGLALTEALRKAAKVTLREDVFAKGKSLARAGKKVAEAAAPKKRATDVTGNLKAARRQPPDEPGTRREKATSLPDMETISEADFDKLPEATQRRLMGYEVE